MNKVFLLWSEKGAGIIGIYPFLGKKAIPKIRCAYPNSIYADPDTGPAFPKRF
jgi:hypothetical protein